MTQTLIPNRSRTANKSSAFDVDDDGAVYEVDGGANGGGRGGHVFGCFVMRWLRDVPLWAWVGVGVVCWVAAHR